MRALGRDRPVFHSEADFQHALAWEIQRCLPHASLRLERPLSAANPAIHLDVLVICGITTLAIELKYKTRDLLLQEGDEQFTLKGHSAEDCGRYDFIKDIERLEQIVASAENTTGYAILLTNDSLYLRNPREAVSIDRAFRLHDGSTLHGVLKWATNASKGTTYKREKALRLNGTYMPKWEDYSRPSAARNGVFRFLAIEIGRFNSNQH